MHIDYERLRRWIRTKGISVRACAQSICRDHPQPKSATESGPVSFIQFAPSSMPVTSVSMRGISITFPDGVNLSLQEGNAESIADLLAIYRSRVTHEDMTFDKPSLQLTQWDANNKYPKANIHFKDRLFDRDTLLLREFSINFLFVIAAYAGYEDGYWASDIRKTIRDNFIASIDEEYDFYILTPTSPDMTTVGFNYLYYEYTRGKIYTLDEKDDSFILAFEKKCQGPADFERFRNARLTSVATGEEVTYTLTKTTLKALDKEQ